MMSALSDKLEQIRGGKILDIQVERRKHTERASLYAGQSKHHRKRLNGRRMRRTVDARRVAQRRGRRIAPFSR